MKIADDQIALAEPSDFHVSEYPGAGLKSPAGNSEDAAENGQDFRLLPRAYGVPFIIAIPRNPKTLFVYWEIDWPPFLAQTAPARRQIHLRLLSAEDAELRTAVIEPMAGNCEISVPVANSAYRAELGYFDASRAWHSVAISESVVTPADQPGEKSVAEFATVPFHLRFERLTELFHGATPIASLAQLQGKAFAGENALSENETIVFHEVTASLPKNWRDDAKKVVAETDLPERFRKIDGASTSSAVNAFGGSSRTR
jgi:hypothetical protein